MSNGRKSPDALLKVANAEENQKNRGSLKIYLGASPGVGKTYSMLQDAHQKLAHGLDVVVGVVESHGREDIIKLLDGLEILPQQEIDYKGRMLKEFDLDGALRRNPGIILIDEMAHTNVGEQRHAKRWQDIKEILDRGIDVYTTLNVQHVESLNNEVCGIIDAQIRETVPDSMIEMADTIELVDLPPEELINRLQAGKVYFPSQAVIAKDHFFKKGNLTALRELALRLTAARVGAQVLLSRQGESVRHIWSSRDKILVCVSSDQESLKLIRSARRLANTLQAEWVAVYIDSPRTRVTDDERNVAIKNLKVAEQLGAETRVISGFDVVKEIMQCAREENCTVIMLWKHIRPRLFSFLRRSLADEVVRASYEINVYIMTGETDYQHNNQLATSRTNKIKRMYLIAAAAVASATLVNWLLQSYVTPKTLIIVYLVAITLVSLLGRFGPALLASFASICVYISLFFPELLNFSSTNTEYLLALIVVILLTQVISYLTVLTRNQANTARLAEKQASDLHILSRKMSHVRGTKNLLNIAAKYVEDLFDSEFTALVPENGTLKVIVSTDQDFILDKKESGVAEWVYELGQKAGMGTDTLAMAEALYLPLIASEGTIGVIRVKPNNPKSLFTPDQMNFMQTCLTQIAMAIEAERYQEDKKQVEIEEQLDNARQIVLKSVTQDLRAPLASIMLTASSQMQMARTIEVNKIREFGENIYMAAEQLSVLINNLLEINALELGAFEIHKGKVELKELINQLLVELRNKLGKHPVYIKVANEIPSLYLDKKIISDILNNLLDNAVKFTPKDKPIEIIAELSQGRVVVSVADHGPGILIGDIDRVFDKFYRGSRIVSEARGLGIGLAICKVLIEAHGGKIWAENRKGGGAIFSFTIPIEQESN